MRRRSRPRNNCDHRFRALESAPGNWHLRESTFSGEAHAAQRAGVRASPPAKRAELQQRLALGLGSAAESRAGTAMRRGKQTWNLNPPLYVIVTQDSESLSARLQSSLSADEKRSLPEFSHLDKFSWRRVALYFSQNQESQDSRQSNVVGTILRDTTEFNVHACCGSNVFFPRSSCDAVAVRRLGTCSEWSPGAGTALDLQSTFSSWQRKCPARPLP